MALLAISLSALFSSTAAAQIGGGKPIIAGSPVVEETLTSSSAGIFGTYKWERCDPDPPVNATCDDSDPAGSSDWVAIPGATSQTYTIPVDDLGNHLRVNTATAGLGYTPSDGVGPVTDTPPPGAQTGEASDITDTRATLNGTIDPNGRQTSYYFEYWVTGEPKSETPVRDAGSGTTLVGVSEPISGLTPSTTYHFRLVAESQRASGPVQVFGDPPKEFTTAALPPPPEAITGSAHTINHEVATLTGTVDPNGVATSYRFEYGPTQSYGLQTPTGGAGSGFNDVAVSASLTGLTPSTVYHYRLVATSAGGERAGADRTFTTSPPPPPVAQHGISVFADPEGPVTAKFPDTQEFVPLEDRLQVIPVNTVIDTRFGTIEITAATGPYQNTTVDESIEFYKGMFRLTQKAKTDARAIAELTGPRICGPFVHRKAGGSSGSEPEATASRRRGRRLWGRGSGRYATSGRGGTGSVVGTTFLTEEKCRGTYFRVDDEPGAHGIKIKAAGLKKPVFLGPGESFLAERPDPKR